jgi:hypothetical protein
MKRLRLAALLVLTSALQFAQNTEERSLTLVFGPTADETGSPAAHSAAVTALKWLNISGAAAEVLYPRTNEGQQFTRFMKTAELEQALLNAAKVGRESGWAVFLNTLDKATYNLSRKLPGKRLLLAVVDTPSASAAETMSGGSEEIKNRIGQTIDFCKSKSITVVVIDSSPSRETDVGPALELLATATGGALVREPQTLDASVWKLAPEPEAKVETKLAAPAAPAGPRVPSVHTQLFRTYPTRLTAASDLGPMNGLMLVECPFSTLEFQTDNKAGTYLARARVTQSVNDTSGKTVWQQKKEFTVKGSLRKLKERRAGSLYYLREVKLPAGQYTIEGAVEDLISGKAAKTSQALRASDSLPGFAVSDALLVRGLDSSADRFEGDQGLSYDGKAVAPMLDPVFRAKQPFDLELYFAIYPDIRGAKPEIGLEILQGGQVVARSQLPFRDEIRNTSTEGSVLDPKGEQKHEFPYLATLIHTTFEAGNYEARVTVRQGGQTIARVVPFRVLDGH